MRHLLPCLLAAVALLLASCNSDQPREAPHAIMVQPAAPTVSAQQESIIAQGTQAAVDARVDAANLKAALAEEKLAQAAEKAATTETDRAAAIARYNAAVVEANAAKQAQAEAEARAKASDAEQVKQRDAEIQGQSDRFYLLGCLLVLGAVFLLKEGNAKCASVAGALALTCFALPSIIRGILAHEQLIFWSIVVAGIAVQAYHYRAKEKVLLAKLEVKAIALEHVMGIAIDDIRAWEHTVHPIAAVEAELKTVWAKVVLDARLAALKLHLITSAGAAAASALPAAPPNAAPPAPASVPVPAPAAPITVVRPLG